MNARQFDAVMALMEEYARNVPGELAEGRMAQSEILRAASDPTQ